jgi:hypothetical protein
MRKSTRTVAGRKGQKRYPYPAFPANFSQAYGLVPWGWDAEKVQAFLMEQYADEIPPAVRPELAEYIRQYADGAPQALIGIADLLKEHGDWQEQDGSLANRALGQLSRVLRAHLEANPAYLASRGRARKGNPLRRWEGQEDFDVANRDLIGDYMTHGEQVGPAAPVGD